MPVARPGRQSRPYLTVLIIETVGLTTPEVGTLSDALKAFRRREDLAAEFLVVNTTAPTWVKKPDLPSGWPPE